MSIEGYQDLPLLPCVDNGGLQIAFDSLRALSDEARNGTADVQCDDFDVTISGNFNDGESCGVLFEEVANLSLGYTPEKCLFLTTFIFRSNVSGNPNGVIETSLNYSLKCDGLIVGSGSLNNEQVKGAFIQAECPPGSLVEICATVDFTQSGVGIGNSAGTFEIDWTLQACGGRLCISEREVLPSQAWLPCAVQQECCYDSSALALIAQNINALSSAYTFGGQSIRCESVTASGNESLPVAINLPSDSVYVVFGAVRACYALNGGERLTVQPVIGCESSQSSCISKTFIGEEDRDGSLPQEVCQTFPVITCGECPEGDSIYVGQSPRVKCNDPLANNNPNDDVIGDYCVWIFSDLSNSLPSVSFPPRCLTSNYVQTLIDATRDIHDAACDRIIPNCTTRFGTDVRPENTPLLIQEAINWQPPIEDPTQDPPKKKWFITGDVIICSGDPQANLEDRSNAYISHQIKCGGDIIYESDEIAWQLAGSGAFDPCSPVQQVNVNIECDITLPLEICVLVRTTGSGTGGTDWQATIDYGAICF